jgi:hypothetical protein
MNDTTFTIGSSASGVSVTIWKRSRPSASDYWDGNWLSTTVEFSIGRFAGSIQGDLRAEELAVFREQVEMLRRSLSGAAEFSTMEEWFGIKLVANGNGQIECIGFVMDQLGIGNRLTFRFSIDQSFLPPMLVSLDTICSKFPAIGKP